MKPCGSESLRGKTDEKNRPVSVIKKRYFGIRGDILIVWEPVYILYVHI